MAYSKYSKAKLVYNSRTKHYFVNPQIEIQEKHDYKPIASLTCTSLVPEQLYYAA